MVAPWRQEDFSGRLRSFSLPLVRCTWLPGHFWNFRGIEPSACLSLQTNFILQHASEKFQIFEHKTLNMVTSYVESHIPNMLDMCREKRALVNDLKLLLHRNFWATVRAWDPLNVWGAAPGNQKQNLPLLPHPEPEPRAGVPWQITLCSPVSEARALLKLRYLHTSSKHNGIINSISNIFLIFYHTEQE